MLSAGVNESTVPRVLGIKAVASLSRKYYVAYSSSTSPCKAEVIFFFFEQGLSNAIQIGRQYFAALLWFLRWVFPLHLHSKRYWDLTDLSDCTNINPIMSYQYLKGDTGELERNSLSGGIKIVQGGMA